MSPPSTLEVFTRFGTDSVGLERALRMVQAILQVLSYYSLPFSLLLHVIVLAHGPASPIPDSALTLSVLNELRSTVALVRRFFRVFRFLESFQAAYKLYSVPVAFGSSNGRGAEVWLEILGRSFNGMYLLLETATLPDALAIQGLSGWGPELAPKIHVEAQRFWFFALLCGSMLGIVRIVKLYAYAPVPATGEGFGDGSKPGEKEGGSGQDDSSQEAKEKVAGEAWKEDRDRLRRTVQTRREHRRKWLRESRGKLRKILRRMAADTLDLALPGAVVGWVPIESGPVGAVMMVTTYLTGSEVWERCAQDLAQAKAVTTAASSE